MRYESPGKPDLRARRQVASQPRSPEQMWRPEVIPDQAYLNTLFNQAITSWFINR